ncbi:MAG: lysophospholipid acyltransferase family protein [Bacteroidetes bacterium]|nr:lysophospholipid acyltransferase family protein [Bacteroidota bacterium]
MSNKEHIRFSHYFEYVGFLLLSFLTCLIPLKKLYRVGFFLGDIGYKIIPSRRRVALQNLINAYPDADRTSLEAIARGSFRNIAATFLEILAYPRMSNETILERVKVENPEVLNAIINEGKGCLVLTAHYGSWEMAMQVIGILYGDRMKMAIEKPLSNPLVNDLIHRYRCAYGGQVLPMQSSVRESLKTLKEGGLVCLAADQSAAKESIAVEFFGRKVPTFTGPAILCLRTGAAMLVGLAVRQPDGNYSMRLHRVETSDIHGVNDANVLELTKRHVALTEQLIRQAPDQWMWTHKRWKHVPDRVQIDL